MDFSTVMLPYGDEWRLHRKLFQHAFRAESEARSRVVYLRRVRTLLTNLLDAPADFELHIIRWETLLPSFVHYPDSTVVVMWPRTSWPLHTAMKLQLGTIPWLKP